MTNSEKLREVIKNSGLKVSYIANKMKMSRTTFWKRVNNVTPFNQYEIVELCKILDIKNELRDSLFFCN